jgi:hypothetical protein
MFFLVLAGLLGVVTWLAASVLAVAGALKLKHPRPAAAFLGQLRFPQSAVLVRLLALAEIAVGLGVLAVDRLEPLVAAMGCYALFIAMLAYFRLRTGQRTVTCGCFGASTSVAVAPHLGALGVATVATALGAATDGSSFLSVLTSVAPAEAILLVALMGLPIALIAIGSSQAGLTAASPPRAPQFRTSAQISTPLQVMQVTSKGSG